VTSEDEEEKRRLAAKALGEDTADLIANFGESYHQDFLVLRTVNAPSRRYITAEQLADAVRSPSTEWLVHLTTMFSLHPEYILDFADLHGIDRETLKESYLAVRSDTGERSVAFEQAMGIEEVR
jgi:hypothetical protein